MGNAILVALSIPFGVLVWAGEHDGVLDKDLDLVEVTEEARADAIFFLQKEDGMAQLMKRLTR
jgi:hypothetical protein